MKPNWKATNHLRYDYYTFSSILESYAKEAPKIATKVFKDGDMLEVDANKGVVRKVK